MYKLNFFVPENNKESVKNALFDLGVGRYDNYDRCSFETRGQGQFRALDGADPYLGKIGETEYVREFKVEMICATELIAEAVEMLKRVHPYEEVAYEVFKMEDY